MGQNVFQILTLHALIPLTTISGCIGVVVMFFGYHHPEMEAMIYIVRVLGYIFLRTLRRLKIDYSILSEH